MLVLVVLQEFNTSQSIMGALWLSGRVLDSRPKAWGFEPHLHHCVVSLSKNINPNLVLVQPRKTRPCLTKRLLMGRKESNQTNKQTRKTRPSITERLLMGRKESKQTNKSIHKL